MPQDSKNLILAIGLSLLVIIGWQYFYSGPKMERERLARIEAQKEISAQNPASPAEPAGASNTPVPQPSPYAPPQGGVVSESRNALLTREAALAQSPRIKIETPSIFGSIALKGARIDDVSLKAYRETPNKNSPNIILLSPSGADQAYYAELGFIAPPGANLLLPKPDSLWTADSEVLTNDRPVTLSFDNGEGLIFRKVISVDDKYMFTVTQTVENKTANEVTLYPYSLVSRHGKPPTSGYSVLHEGMVGVIGQSGIEEITYDKIEKEDHAQKTLKGTGGWLGFTDKYWAAVIVPSQTAPFEGRFSASGSFYKSYQADYLGDAKVIAPGGSTEISSRIFAGAKEVPTLDKYQKELGIEKFDLLIDWGWFYFITKPMFWLMDTIYKIVGNFGVAILITTVIVKAIFYPLASKSYQSMARMKGLQPKLNELKVKYPDDKVKQQQEMMELYKREKINPVAGCLPMLIQIPVFFALYKVLFITIEMRQAPFFGWIHDLSQPDPTNVFNLFGLLPVDPTQLPLIGHFLAIGVWPLIMGVSMFIQMKMNPEPTDPVQKQMFTYMPVLFTFMLGTFPVGLVIYWTWNNLLSVTQQGIIMRRNGVKIELWDNLMGLFHKKAVT